jgi:hypothetical protein
MAKPGRQKMKYMSTIPSIWFKKRRTADRGRLTEVERRKDAQKVDHLRG